MSLQVNKDILEKFVNTVKGKEGSGSNLLNISVGPHLSEALLSSAIIQVKWTGVFLRSSKNEPYRIQGEDGANNMGSTAGYEFGVDPNEDPELALALRVSMEEQRARQEAESRTTDGAPAPALEPSTSSSGEKF